MARYETLGAAKKAAYANAKRDDCKWNVWYNRLYSSSSPFETASEFEEKNYWWSEQCYTAKPEEISKHENAVVLTDEEKQLVVAVLDPNEIGREYFPGSEQTKVSLWKKLVGGKK